MKKQLLSILLLLLSFGLLAQEDTEFNVHGTLLSEDLGSPIETAHIFNITKKTIVTSDRYGDFSFRADIGDQIKITFIGYTDLYVNIVENMKKNPKPLLLKMKAKSYLLDDIAVVPWKTYEDFKYALLKIKLPKKYTLKDFNINLKNVCPGYNNTTVGNKYQTMSSSNMVNFVALAKRVFKKRNVKMYTDRDREKEYLFEKKYNRNIVQQIVKLDSARLDNFILYCNTRHNFDYKTNELEIIKKIKEFFAEYKILVKDTIN